MIIDIVRYILIAFVVLGIEIMIYSTVGVFTKKNSLKWIVTGIVTILSLVIYYVAEVLPKT